MQLNKHRNIRNAFFMRKLVKQLACHQGLYIFHSFFVFTAMTRVAARPHDVTRRAQSSKTRRDQLGVGG